MEAKQSSRLLERVKDVAQCSRQYKISNDVKARRYYRSIIKREADGGLYDMTKVQE